MLPPYQDHTNTMETVTKIPELRSAVFGLLSVNDVDAVRMTCKTYKKTLELYYMRRALSALIMVNPQMYRRVATHNYVTTNVHKKVYKRRVPTCIQITTKGKQCRHKSQPRHYFDVDYMHTQSSPYCTRHAQQHGYIITSY